MQDSATIALAPPKTAHRSTTQPLLVAHRAGNDLARLRRAEQLGIPLVECDLHWFRGRVEVRHQKTIGPLPVLWDRWYLADPRTPRLELRELLVAAAPSTELMLDLKGRSRRLPEAVAAALAEADRPARVTVCARHAPLLDPLRGIAGVRLVRSVGSARQLARLERTAFDRAEGVSIHRDLLDAAVVARLRERTDLLMTWPVFTPDEVRELGAWGVHGAITERFEELAA